MCLFAVECIRDDLGVSYEDLGNFIGNDIQLERVLTHFDLWLDTHLISFGFKIFPELGNNVIVT